MFNVNFEAMNKEVFKILEDISNLNVDIETGWNKLLSLHLVSKPLPKGVKIKSAETPQGFEFDQIDYDNWLESDIDDLDDFLEQELC